VALRAGAHFAAAGAGSAAMPGWSGLCCVAMPPWAPADCANAGPAKAMDMEKTAADKKRVIGSSCILKAKSCLRGQLRTGTVYFKKAFEMWMGFINPNIYSFSLRL
jgi:hypothetical protein